MSMSDDLLPILKFCENHNIEVTFITALANHGLIEIIEEEELLFVRSEHVPRLEKIVRLHFELDINIEGIDAITNVLERLQDLQTENTALRNRLRLYE